MGKSKVKGASSLRRLFRRLPDAAREEMATFLGGAGARLAGRARAETPRKTGELASKIGFKLAAKTLMLRIGLITKRDQRDYFYGYILDEGRRARRVRITRGPRAGATMNIPGISRERYNFVFGRRQDFVSNELPKFRSVMDRILLRAAQGGGDD